MNNTISNPNTDKMSEPTDKLSVGTGKLRHYKRRMRPKPQRTTEEQAQVVAGAITGIPLNTLAKRTGIPRNTCRDIIARNPEAIAEAKSVLRQRALTITDLALDQCEHALPDASALQAATVAGIMIQRGLGELSDNQAGHAGLNAAGPTLTQNNLHVHLPSGTDAGNSPEILARTIALLQSGGLKRTD